ncbi:hypothetical protein FB451DRAFT_1186788 [Mycena latifolia]|nr:hypothetical protein FB451DRAFT_1186788 [Mycena latifolia]
MGFTVQISNWKQVGGLQLIGTLLEQVKLLPKQIPTCGTPSNGVSISNWGWWRPPMQPVTYREASQAIQLSHQMNLPVFTGIRDGGGLRHSLHGLGSLPSSSTISSDEFTWLQVTGISFIVDKFQTGKLKASDTSGINYEPSKEQASKAISRRHTVYGTKGA